MLSYTNMMVATLNCVQYYILPLEGSVGQLRRVTAECVFVRECVVCVRARVSEVFAQSYLFLL